MVIDTLIIFIAGGNLRIANGLERVFVGIFLLGAFFITILFGGDLLNCIYHIWNLKIDSLEQLADVDPPTFMSPTLNVHANRIYEMIKFDVFIILISNIFLFDYKILFFQKGNGPRE